MEQEFEIVDNETSISRTSVRRRVISVILKVMGVICILISVHTFIILLGFPISVGSVVFLMIPVLLSVIFFYLSRIVNFAYDYSFENNTLFVAKVYGESKRKNVIDLPLGRSLYKIGSYENDEFLTDVVDRNELFYSANPTESEGKMLVYFVGDWKGVVVIESGREFLFEIIRNNPDCQISSDVLNFVEKFL